MGLRPRILDPLHRGDDQGDPDEFVELTTVPLPSGPLLVARLERAGIDAVGDEAYHPGTGTLSLYRVMVRRRDLDAALAASADTPT